MNIFSILKYFLLGLFWNALPCCLLSQQWIDTIFAIQTFHNITYGTAIDFAGTQRNLEMDISIPIDDTPPPCGRPLIVLIHGGGWLWGDKTDLNISKMREDFAKRGYVSVAVNYRLGQFHTNQFINCNIPVWNCLNMADTAEWYRANHRAIQDVNGAVRYLVNNATTYNINPDNIFIAGESAGGFIAMGVGFIDSQSEIIHQLVGDLPAVASPNILYEGPCIQTYQLAPSIQAMNLMRPALGSYEGTLNIPVSRPYQIRGVGNFYGGVFNNIFYHNNSSSLPVLYLYHQLCDLVVHNDRNRLFQGYQDCLMGFPTYCGYIIHRPYVSGSTEIKSTIDAMNNIGVPAPTYFYDFVSNSFNCLQQTDQGLSCHSIDNFDLRTRNMALFFAQAIDSCSTSHTYSDDVFTISTTIYPNPFTDKFIINANQAANITKVSITNIQGKCYFEKIIENEQPIEIYLPNAPPGVYIINVQIKNSFTHQNKIIKISTQ